MICMPLNTTQELIEDIAAGKMVIIMDDEDRENEGDFIIAAQHCAAEHVNFMAKHGRGLICLTLTDCLLYTSPSPRDVEECRMPSSA